MAKEKKIEFHKNLTNWEQIFNKKLSIVNDNQLTINHIKDALVDFLESAEPPILLDRNRTELPLKLKQSDLSIYLEDTTFKQELYCLSENNISAFELLSKIIGDNSFEQGIEENYFYGFDLSETPNLFEQSSEL